MSSIADVYPLSPLQSGILYHSLRAEDASVYFLQFSYRINGRLVPSMVEQAFNELLKRHDILRTVFNYDDLANPVQLVLRERKIEFYLEDMSHLQTEEAREEAVKNFRKRDQARGFDLRKDVLMRVAVLQFSEEAFEVVWSFHHILMDGWCMSILIHEFLETYNSLVHKRPVSLAAVTPYKQYIQWLQSKDHAAVLAYWKKYLDGFEQDTPLAGTINAGNAFELQEEWLVLDAPFTKEVEKLAARLQVTVNAVVQAAWGLLLGYYNDCDDVVFGTIVSGRPAEIRGIESMIGLFINAIPVRVQAGKHDSFSGLVKEIHNDGVEAINYSHCQLADIQAASAAGNRLLDHLLVFENYPIQEQIEGIARSHGEETDNEQLDVPSVNIFERSNYNLSLVIIPGEQLYFKFRYNRFAYEKEWIERLRGHFNQVLQQVIANPEIAAGQITLLTPAEQQTILQKGAGKKINIPAKDTVVSIFEQKVLEYPQHTALAWEGGSFTYEELNSKANILAQTLLNTHHVQRGDCIAVMMERSPWAILSIIAILKTGAVYVPVDPGYPQDRISNILAQSSVKMMLTDSDTMFRAMEFYQGEMLAPDIQFEELEQNTANPCVEIKQDDVSYIIFTSGSTGTPNGVMITHRGQVNMYYSQKERFALTANDKILQFASLSFDASVWEISMALLSGAALVLVKKSQADDATVFADYIKKQQVSIVTLPPVYLNVVDISSVPSLRIIITAGEEARPEDVRKYSKQLSYFNAYGPSEYAVCISAYEAGKEISDMARVPVGTAFFNTNIYLLDTHLRLVPDGMPGEICVSGAGIAKGYLNNEMLTSRRFVADPFNPGEKLYHTGDRGRWVNGNLEFLGRRDEQIKIRGHRVETGEVAAAILALNGVHDVFVLAQKEEGSGTYYLTAYYTGIETLSDAQMQNELAKKLPAYMMPAFFIKLERLPLNTNGKVDKKALPVPGLCNDEVEDLATENERQLAAIWSEVLGITVKKRTDNFFSLGGHSLKVIQVASRVLKQYGVRLEIKDVFDHPTLAALTAFITEMRSEGFETIRILPDQEYYAIAHAQKRLWILDQLEQGVTAYNIPHAYRITGSLNRYAFEKAFRFMVDRHEALRTVITAVGNEPLQKIYDAAHFTQIVEYKDLSTLANPLSEALSIAGKEGGRIFSLAHGPLFHFAILKLANEDHVLLINFHHIVADGWSMMIFVREIIAAYHAFCNGMQPSLEPLRIQYKEYAAWQQAQLSGSRLKEYRKFWMDMYRDKVPVLQLPADHSRPAEKTYRGGWQSFEMDTATFEALQEFARTNDVTLFMLMRAMLHTLLYAYSGQPDMTIGSPVAGRDHVDLEHIVGFFINMIPVRIQCKEEDSFLTLLNIVKTEMLKVYKYQVYPFDQLLDDLSLQSQAGHSPLFDVMMVVQSQNDSPAMDTVNGLGAGTQISELEAGYNVSKYDLTFTFNPGAGSMSVSIEYSLDLFEEPRIALMCEYLKNTCTAVLKDPGVSISHIRNSIMGKLPGKNTRKNMSFDFTSQ